MLYEVAITKTVTIYKHVEAYTKQEAQEIAKENVLKGSIDFNEAFQEVRISAEEMDPDENPDLYSDSMLYPDSTIYFSK